jgi:hypothetical protein
VYSGPGGSKWERPVGGLVVARFRHWDSRHRMPLLHDHLVVSVKVLRADGKWGHLDSRRLLAHVVAAGALYNQRVLEEVCDRLGLATEPRTPTPGLRPVMEIAGVPPELIAWTATRQRDTAVLLEQAEAEYTAGHGYPPTARVRSRLMKRAADDSRPAKKTPLPMSELRRRWRADAIRRFGTELVDGLLELCRRAAAAIRSAWTTVTPTGDGGRRRRGPGGGRRRRDRLHPPRALPPPAPARRSPPPPRPRAARPLCRRHPASDARAPAAPARAHRLHRHLAPRPAS